MNNKQTKNTLRIYGAGGTGLNITNMVTVTGQSAGFPMTDITQADTSNSNLGDVGENCTTTIFPGVHGTGKSRPFSVSVVTKPLIEKLLLTNPPGNFNIVVFGASGGSGSVIGPMIIEELMKRGETVVGMVVVSTTSGVETDNAVGCLTDLHKISRRLKLPVVCSFYDNGGGRDYVNAKVEAHVRALAMLVSGENDEIDLTDVHNWVNYPANVNVAPMLVDLVVILGDEDRLSAPEHALSMITLHGNTPSTGLDICIPLYHAEGTLSHAAQAATSHVIGTMDYIVTNTRMNTRMRELETKRQAFNELLDESAGVVPHPFNDDDGVM